MSKNRPKNITFHNGNIAPVLGFGTWQLTGKQAVRSISHALETGYKHIDTADIYGNHKEAGKAISSSGIKRKDLFITTKVWHDNLEKDKVRESIKRFQEELQMEYFDLLLIHWPNKEIPVQDTMEAMVEAQEEGVIKNYGVSNFTIKHLEEVIEGGYHPAVNQVEFHPSLNQKELKKYCDVNNVVITAYSPIAQGEDLKLEEIKEIASKYSRSESQVVLNWIMQKGMIAIPRSSDPTHIEDNFASVEWKLEEKDIKRINELNSGNRLINPSISEFSY